jgi:16S rRNA (guanine(966)-N(2))-methyltransferase RsmD
LSLSLLHVRINLAPEQQKGKKDLLRVISGKCKGKKLFALKGLSLRPTSDRVKEAVFDILQKFPPGKNVLDLFAGTGALGIEALSRGAQRAVFVEGSVRSGAVLRRNIEACRLSGQAEVISKEVQAGLKALEEREDSFDLIFLDPPYGKGLAYRALGNLSQSRILSVNALIVAEHSPDEDLSSISSLERIDRRKYGGTEVSFFRWKGKE